jgi:hypothetical protein
MKRRIADFTRVVEQILERDALPKQSVTCRPPNNELRIN